MYCFQIAEMMAQAQKMIQERKEQMKLPTAPAPSVSVRIFLLLNRYGVKIKC